MIDKEKLIKDLEEKEWYSDYARNMGCDFTFRYILNEIIDDIKKGKYEVLCSDAHDVDKFYKE